MEEIIFASATTLARVIREQQVSSQEVVEAYLNRIAAINPALNAVVQLRAEAARTEARQADEALARGENNGPLHGTTFATENLTGFSYAMTHSLTGWPVVVVRGGTSPEGLPIGIQVVARPWREDVALAVAQQIETALGGWQRPTI